MKWVFVIFLLSFILDAQVKESSQSPQPKEVIAPSVRIDKKQSNILAVFHKIENGIRTSSVDEFENDLAAMVVVTIGSGERGCFSTNQAVSVLTGYYSGLHSVSFNFSRIHEECPAPYATGRLVYVRRGIQESAQVYVSLTRQKFRWVISQFNIY
jgi:hypothetical protein